MTSRSPHEGQRYLREAPLKPLKEQFLALQETLLEAARNEHFYEATTAYGGMRDTLRTIVRARVPAKAASKRADIQSN